MKTPRIGPVALALLVQALGCSALATEPPPTRPAEARGTVVIPDRLLRRWDPVTVFFAADTGPAAPSPEDHPERFVRATPAQPGAWRWLDRRTLQFRPAEAWPSLARFRFEADGVTTTLATLMEPPKRTLPAADTEGLDAVREITLVFAEPLEVEALRAMVGVELLPLPGIGPGESRHLTRDDFEVKALERASRAAEAGYVLVLREPIPLGTRARVRLRLSLDDAEQESFREVSFMTAQPFRVSAVGCRERRLPVTPAGSRYAREQAVSCPSSRTIVVDFSATPRAFGAVEGRNLVRFTPAVPNLEFSAQGRTLEVSGDFAWDTLYSVALAPTPLVDEKGRRLELSGRSEVFLFFPRRPAYVRWKQAGGIAERLGPQMVPVEGRGEERVDVRIHRIDPLDRSFWPFPDSPLTSDDSSRPPGPGETPPAFTDAQRNPTVQELQRQLTTLGSPAASTLLALPLKREGSAASFGLDLAPVLARIAGKGAPGTYLVGLRDLAGGSRREWMRLQVTDLSLSTLEEPAAVRFQVTSLASGEPVAGARVRVEGTLAERGQSSFATLAEGVTGLDGSYRWSAPGAVRERSVLVRRLVVQKDDDTLVLDASRAPERYADNQWSRSRDSWLQWTVEPLAERGLQAEVLAHLFTERPVYRPEEPVHIKGYLRRRAQGRFTPVRGDGFLVVEAPGELVWRYAVKLGDGGSFYVKFQEKDVPTGTYTAHFEDAKRENRYGSVAFQVEAYSIPRFEVTLHAPERAGLDRAFEVSLTAAYYAGGRVAGQPVRWRVAQFPHAWTPRKREGFLYSSDARFSRSGRFEATPRLDREDVTSEDGSARIALDPTIEPTAEPRLYVVEATVTGPDDQTVTATRRIPALPPFVLGLKLPRYIEKARAIEGELLVAGPDGKLVAGREVTVRLLRREWHSHLRASDFSDGVARYVTDTVDVKVSETRVSSAAEPSPLRLPIDRSGVYVVELESHDRLERAQVVSADLYAGGDEPVAWPKPVTAVFSVGLDQKSYDPGATARLVLQSPFQSARALAIVEAPEGNEYRWLDVANGSATFSLPVLGHWAPRLPVHFVLMRGRLPGSGPLPGSQTDLGKPATLAATAWLDVNPVANRAEVTLEYPKTARPGQVIDVGLTLADPKGAPLAGEVTLWLVDQAVLALGREQRLDPLPDFLKAPTSHLSVHDTRNLALGALPFAEFPGGDEGEGGADLLDRATVRKNFQSVPYYNPAIVVGASGKATVKITLSDDLTNFKLRAKAIAGPERFGFATGQLAVRLPVIVQPALPRFVRPGDRFAAAAIGRVVEGEGGPGAASVRAAGVELLGPARSSVSWAPNTPVRIETPVSVKTPPYTADGRLAYREVRFRMGVERTSDGASDAFEAVLPVRDDRARVNRRLLQEVVAGTPLALPAISEAARPGTFRREILLTTEPGLVKMAAGLDFLREYPYGCTEQQASRARAYLALRKFRALLGQTGGEAEIDRAVKDTLAFIPGALDPNGLVAYWPGSRGYVSLTAWTVQFLLEARAAGYGVDERLLSGLLRTLEQALRSDYSRFIDGESWAERAWALLALAEAGQASPAYAAELARRAEFLDLEGVSQVLAAFPADARDTSIVAGLARSVAGGIATRLFQGREIYAGLQERRPSRNGLILPSETRSLAEALRALARKDPRNPKLPLMSAALVTLGRDDGWGSTNANAAALLALSERLAAAGGPSQALRVRVDGGERSVSLGAEARLASVLGLTPAAAEVLLPAGAPLPVLARVTTSYVPAADGSQAEATAAGFVVTREALVVRGEDQPAQKHPLERPAQALTYAVGTVVEDHVQVVNPKDRHYVAVVVPLAAGLEPLNPGLATAPPEARPKGALTLTPSYVAFLDDQVAFYYDTLPAGTYDFYFRARATHSGSFTQPPARAEMMYDASVFGGSVGARVEIGR